MLTGPNRRRFRALRAQIERLYREVRAYAIPGGSEEIMSDLAVKQSMKLWSMTTQVMAKMKKARSKEAPQSRL